ncbi:MAG: transcriptional regulator, Crp/Fnr family [uncultured Thiotrichaceae bacterium]|uniref:Transcriptional regulator, Crp/Fnr family n=1 Tax=uncultured Thiotrichaceae bacterium TaxID=298394 RepID=A0A6S6SGQ0_9GAMM|nr:MAG: transcriptional regulator, Crp/Fnr family [uncultured Thiotrichaceae bacterium]
MNSTLLKQAWQGVANCSQCSIRNSVLFAGLTEQDFAQIHKPIDQFQIKKGAKIYSIGDDASSMFTIRSGLVKLVQYLPDGTKKIVRLLGTADVMGLEAVFNSNYRHDAIALHDTEICRYPGNAAKELSKTNPTLHHELMYRWECALDEADKWATEFSTGSSKQRVSRLFLKLVKEDHPANTCTLFSRDDLGAILGLTTETASRAIADFKRQGVIVELSANTFTCDIVKLKQLAFE